MMGKTHVFVGTASALLLMMPDTAEGCLAALIGGAAGGIVCDVDMKLNKESREDLHTRLLAAGIVGVSLLIDLIVDGGILAWMRGSSYAKLTAGIVLFAVLCLTGALQNHRGFTHSILGLASFSFAVGLFCKPALVPFVIGYGSHLVLDLMNKRPMKLFYPIETGVCLKWCYSNRVVNQVLLILGAAVTVVYVLWFMVHM